MFIGVRRWLIRSKLVEHFWIQVDWDITGKIENDEVEQEHYRKKSIERHTFTFLNKRLLSSYYYFFFRFGNVYCCQPLEKLLFDVRNPNFGLKRFPSQFGLNLIASHLSLPLFFHFVFHFSVEFCTKKKTFIKYVVPWGHIISPLSKRITRKYRIIVLFLCSHSK